jgi:annexin A7/11
MATHGESPDKDAEIIHKAIKGLGTDEKAIISVLGHRTKQQVGMIAQAYKTHYKDTLEKALVGDTGGHFGELCAWRALPPVEVRKALLTKATKGAGTAEKYLIDVLAPATNAEILEVYQNDPTTIAKVLNDVSHGDFAKVIHELLKGKRQEWEQIDDVNAANVAERFYKAGEGKLGTDEKVFNELLTTHGPLFLDRVNHHYMAKHKHTLETAIKKETSGHYEDLLVGLTKAPLIYYCDRLYSAIHGAGTDERALNFIFAILDFDELRAVKQLYEQRHKVPLEKAIKGDTSGNYEDLLVALLHN